MLQLIQSNRTELLLERLSGNLSQAARRGSVLAPQTVLVQSQGMRQWLTLELAQRQGIVANLATPMPAAFLWQICRRVMREQLPPHSAFDKETLSWQIMALLPKLLEQDAFSPLRDYLAVHRQEQLQRYQLAYRIADVFDHYLVYRPDWILDWEAGGGSEVPLEQGWQPLLWRALVNLVEDQSGGLALHRANLHQQVMLRLQEGGVPGLPDWVGVFGVSSLPPQQLDLLSALSRSCAVDIFALNPCRHYWGDIVSEKNRARRRAANMAAADDYLEVGNPLLASWGDQGRDFFDLLVERDVPSDDAFFEAEPVTLLQSLQQRILKLEHSDETFTLTPGDHSLQIHDCHSRMREVEVLRDQLLAMFAADSHLRARDIVVMVPDIAAYSAYVHAVFSQPGQDVARLRYSISDRSQSAESPVLRSFMALLGLPESRLAAPQIVDLLETPAIARRFGFAPEELRRLSYWIEETGIRWAWDGDDKQALGLPPNHINTWQFGLDRLMLGYAMGSAEQLYHGILPSGEVDGNSGDLLGRLQFFLERLRYWRQAFAADYPWREWQQLVSRCIDEMFETVEEESLALDGLRQGIATLLQDATVDCLDEAITPALLRSLLQQLLEQAGGNYGFLAGGISFCSLMPMRSIPFKVVCMLGLNDQDFPRQQAQPGFDLVASDVPRRGDRNRRSDDRYQVLEALLSARQRLYISYVGRDVLDNSDKVAAVPLSELLEYCQGFVVCEGDGPLPPEQMKQRAMERLVRHHHLQPFDRRYFEAADRYWFSYAAEYLNAAGQQAGQSTLGFAQQALPDEPIAAVPIRLEQLSSFVANPCKVLLQQRLGVYLDLQEGELPDSETMELDGLQRFVLGQAAIEQQLAGHSQQHWQDLVEARGEAPLGSTGVRDLERLWSRVVPVSDAVEPLLTPEPASIGVDLSLGDYRIEGEIGPLFGDSLVQYRPSPFRSHQILQAWLRHATANAVHGPVTSHLVDSKAHQRFAPIDPAQARHWLAALLPWYALGRHRPLALFPRAAWAWLEQWHKSGDAALAMDRATAAWWGNERSRGEADDAYIARCFTRLELVQEEFEQLTRELIEPVFQALESAR